jgi:hypothetical protein
VSASLQQGQAWEKLRITINEPVPQSPMILVRASGREARMSAPRLCMVFALDDKLRPRKGIMVSAMVYVEMGTDEDVDFIRSQPKCSEVLDHIFSILGARHTRLQRIPGHPAVDQDMLPIPGFDEIAARDHFDSSSLS